MRFLYCQMIVLSFVTYLWNASPLCDALPNNNFNSHNIENHKRSRLASIDEVNNEKNKKFKKDDLLYEYYNSNFINFSYGDIHFDFNLDNSFEDKDFKILKYDKCTELILPGGWHMKLINMNGKTLSEYDNEILKKNDSKISDLIKDDTEIDETFSKNNNEALSKDNSEISNMSKNNNEINETLSKDGDEGFSKFYESVISLREEVWYGNYLNIQIIKQEDIKNKFVTVGNNSSYSPGYEGIITEDGIKKYPSFERNCIMYFNANLDNDRRPQDVDKLCIGSWCSFASNVRILLGGKNGHDTDDIAVAPLDAPEFSLGIKNPEGFDWRLKKSDTFIGNDVWVGYDALIMGASKISHGAVIGARSVVRGNVGPFEIWFGNPAVCHGRRFDNALRAELDHEFINITNPDEKEEKIQERFEGFYKKLLELKWWYWPHDEIASHINILKRKSKGHIEVSEAINTLYDYYLANKDRLDEDETRKKFAETDAILDNVKNYKWDRKM